MKTNYEIPYSYKKKPFFDFIKRFFDILFSFIFIIALSWLIIIIAILVKCTSKGPIFFKHYRVGKNNKDIGVLKFRTMKKDAEDVEHMLSKEDFQKFLVNLKLEHDPRATKFGRILRKTSLDELPQLFNIFIGDLSFIGPRPIMRKYEFERFGEYQDLLVKVKPGLTGFWAANGRNSTTYDERVKMELYYVTKRSLWLDIKILFKTVIAVITTKGAV